jgi:hypothetical protein
MDPLIKGLVESAPHLTALVIIVLTFVRHLEKRDTMIETLHREHLDERRESRKVIEAAAQAREDNTAALNKLVNTLETTL